MSLNDLSLAALKAAMEGGTEAWGQHGSIFQHRLYVEPQEARGSHYRKCQCGCGLKAKFRLMANGVCMSEGCELSLRREMIGGRGLLGKLSELPRRPVMAGRSMVHVRNPSSDLG